MRIKKPEWGSSKSPAGTMMTEVKRYIPSSQGGERKRNRGGYVSRVGEGFKLFL